MTPAPRHALCALLLALLLPLGPAVSHAQTPGDVNDLLEAWRMPQAKALLQRLEHAGAWDPHDLLYLKGRLAFFDGDYAKAVALYDQALQGRDVPAWASERQLVKNTLEVTATTKAYTSPKGYFTLHVDARDEVLLPYAFDALDKAYDALATEIGHRPEVPIRVEIYPTTQTLAKVSPLSDQEIRTSGTIALCKYNRLMITSPRALLQGYGWVDTLVHEYVHYLINHKSQNRVPIWMHEGMAKFLERRWRGPEAQRLSPASESLLFARLDQNKLIPFAKMHPSMAKLPSQEDTAVAFAEVYTVMEYLRREAGEGAFATVLEGIDQGLEAPEAFSKAIGAKDFKTFEASWRRYLATRPRPVEVQEGGGFGQTLRFKSTAQDAATQGPRELDQIPAPKAREHALLGQMMQARGRFGAAVVEYQKASQLSKTLNPLIQTRLAQSLIKSGQPAKAYDSLKEVCALHPSYVTSWLVFGEAALAIGKLEEAEVALLEAARINPFDPEVHVQLSQVFAKQGQAARAAQERAFASLVK